MNRLMNGGGRRRSAGRRGRGGEVREGRGRKTGGGRGGREREETLNCLTKTPEA